MKVELWTNEQTGEIVCVRHAGYQLSSAIDHRPKAKTHMTSFGRFRKWEEIDDALWHREFGEGAQCESCRYDKER